MALACTPESLEGLDGEPTNNGTNNVSTNNTSANGGTANFTADYLAVHAIVTGKCALAGCHGPNSAGGNFLVPTGESAQPAELQASLSDVLANSGDLLIAPGDSGGSDIYNRLLGQGGPLMPTTGSLPQSEIDTIQSWIDGGAVYTQ